MAFVTGRNWKEACSEAIARMNEAAFVAVDLELSGVQTTQWRAATQVDTLQTRYLNLRDSAEKFAILQFGLCPFVWDAANGKFISHPFNFCLFPRNELPVEMPTRDFLCQATSLEFLAKHHFDFNACIHDGISYLSREQEALARIRLGLAEDCGGQETSIPEIPLTRTADVLFTETVRVRVGQWRDDILHCKTVSEDQVRPHFCVKVSGNHQANLVHQLLRKSFKGLVPQTENDEEGAMIVKVLFPRSTKERVAMLEQWEKDKRERIEAQLKDAVGFRHLIDALVDSCKPIVGHNCFLDFAHIYSKFFGTLPLSCSEFCSALHQQFPCIFDTKYLLKTDSSIRELLGDRNTTLGVVYSYLDTKLSEKAIVEFAGSDEGCSRYIGSDLKHEAGYDAFMTGVIFANMCHVLKFDPRQLQGLPEQTDRQISGLPNYANLLYLGWLTQFVLDLTTGKEATGLKSLKMHQQRAVAGDRCDRIALVWSSDSASQDLEKHVRSCLNGTTADMEVIGIDETSAFLVFRRRESLELLINAYESSPNSQPENQQQCQHRNLNFQRLVESGLKVARFQMFERLCQSPLSTSRLTDSVQLLKPSHSGGDNDAGVSEAAADFSNKKKRRRF